MPFSCILRGVTCDRRQATEIGRRAATFLDTRQHCHGPLGAACFLQSPSVARRVGGGCQKCHLCHSCTFYYGFHNHNKKLHKPGLTWDGEKTTPVARCNGQRKQRLFGNRNTLEVPDRFHPLDVLERPPPITLLLAWCSSWTCAGFPRPDIPRITPLLPADLHADVTLDLLCFPTSPPV